MRIQKKNELAQKRRWRVRAKISGTASRPRMSVCFTGQHIYVQFIDDDKGFTLASASTRCAALAKGGEKVGANVASAVKVGRMAAEAAQAQGIANVVFDRGSAQYHGKVKALADAAREAGLKF